MKMAVGWDDAKDAVLKKRKRIHGGVGCFGIAAIACACAMNRAKNRIVISICVKWFRMLPTISELHLK